MEEFFTRDSANEGIDFPLYRPDGTKSDHSLRLRSVDSDEYHRANIEVKRKFRMFELEAKGIDDKKKREDYLAEKQREVETFVIASLVKSWTFDKECSRDNIIDFLTNAPQIAQAINRITTQRELFLAKGQDNLKNSQEAN